MTKQSQKSNQQSLLHGFLSMIVPGLGQMVAGFWARGISFLLAVLVMGGLSIWTIAQRARYPDYALSLKLYFPLVLQAAALLLMLHAVRHLLIKYIIKDAATKAFSSWGVAILYVILIIVLSGPFLNIAGTTTELKTIHLMTAVLSAGWLGAFWLWQANDAIQVGPLKVKEELPNMLMGLFLISLVIFSLGWNITGIDMEKAISEYQDTNIILRRIVWPWRNAFEFEQTAVEVTQKIQSPCPEGAVGPPSNETLSDAAWVSAYPTCGQMTERDLRGKVTFGTELTISGGGFTPGQEVEIWWKNPIGNPFQPRGVGETTIITDEHGEFETLLFIPEVIINLETSLGDQIHTLVVREESEEVFTGRLSREMNLALVGMLETIMMALMATFFGIILAFPISFLAARNLMAPIVSPMHKVAGAVSGVALGLYATTIFTGLFAKMMGGFDEAPVLVFIVALLLTFILGYLGAKLLAFLFGLLFKHTGVTVTNIVTAIFISLLAAGPGYLLGLGFSRLIMSIPLSAEVAAETEMSFALTGAIILGLVGLFNSLRTKAEGEIKIGLAIYTITRTLMNIIRSIEPIIWAIVCAIWVGLGPFAGTIALVLHTVAALGKLYSESIESIDSGPIEALQATGANRLQTIVYAVVPQILPPFISFTIYRWDINVRMSTVIGLVGGGGIGFILIQWIRQFQYENAGIAVWLITITVATLDYISSNIRERYV